MLRLSSDDEAAVKGFQSMHSQAKKECFGRLLRSPTVWEDLVKCILLCNCGQALAALSASNRLQTIYMQLNLQRKHVQAYLEQRSSAQQFTEKVLDHLCTPRGHSQVLS